jgi:tetratricopeptide (TPR) repeat protein
MRTLDDYPREESPNKRARTDIADNLQNGGRNEAERCSADGIDHADDMMERAVPDCISALAPCSKPNHKADPQQERFTAEQSLSKQLHIYQKQEYDEGMYVYKSPVPTEGDVPEALFRPAATLYNAGQILVAQGKYSEAMRWFEIASLRLKLHMESAGLPTLLFVDAIHNLGYCHFRLGNNDDAMTCFTKALEIAKRVGLGEMDEAAITNCIGVLHFHQEESSCWDKSLEMMQMSLAVFEKHLSDESPKLATLLNNIGRVHYRKGDYTEALKFYKRALTIRRNQLGNQSVDVAATICNTGQTYHQRGEFDKALQYYQEFLQMAKTGIGSNHSRDVAVVANCMAEIYHERREMEKAQGMYEDSLAAALKSFGTIHPYVASILQKLGSLHYEMNNLGVALRYYTDGFKVEEVVHEASHPHILAALMNIAQIHREGGEFRLAMLFYSDAHSRTVKVYGPDSLETANLALSMGLMQYQLKAHEAAFEFYQEALRIQRIHYGSDDNADVASSLNSIGLVLFNQGIHEMAKECFFESLRIRRKLLGPNHRDVAILCYNIATIHLECRNDELAITYYKETLRVERLALGPKHEDVVLTLQHLGLVFQQRGQLEEAAVYFAEALDIERTKSDPESQRAAAKLLNLLGNIHLQSANVKDMMTCFAHASRIYSEHGQPCEGLIIAGYNFYGLNKVHPPGAQAA